MWWEPNELRFDFAFTKIHSPCISSPLEILWQFNFPNILKVKARCNSNSFVIAKSQNKTKKVELGSMFKVWRSWSRNVFHLGPWQPSRSFCSFFSSRASLSPLSKESSSKEIGSQNTPLSQVDSTPIFIGHQHRCRSFDPTSIIILCRCRPTRHQKCLLLILILWFIIYPLKALEKLINARAEFSLKKHGKYRNIVQDCE